MVKKSNSKRRGICRGVQRNKIRASKAKDEAPLLLSRILHTVGANNGHGSLSGKICMKYVIKVCTLFCLVPFQTDSRGICQKVPLIKMIVHYFLALLYVSFLIYKFVVTIYVVVFEELSAATFMCAWSMIALAVGISGSLGTSWTTAETMDPMNGYETLRGTINEAAGNKLEVYENAPLCMKLIVMTFMAHCETRQSLTYRPAFQRCH